MKIIIVGCGRLGSDLAVRLCKHGNDVVVIDQTASAFNNLPSSFQGRLVEGEALREDVLHRAGIEKADALAAVTNIDALNAVVAHLARTIYHVPNVVARNYDPQTQALHEAFGLQTVSSTLWGSQRIEELLYHSDVKVVFSAGNGEVDIYEFIIPESWSGRKLQDFIIPEETNVSILTRAGKAILPSPDMPLECGDIVVVSATQEGVEEIRRKLKSA
ncbi:MAG TPA: TrkA family potassium uptake protein [Anaerolineaceae bacterium]|nr:TrkA family potassium uptake protein [Anaerolineaceae bacterium]